MTDVATTGASAPNTQGGSQADDSNLDEMLLQMALLNNCLTRVGEHAALLGAIAGAVDEAITEVDEESGRVEAPTATLHATDAANAVGKAITAMVAEVGQHCRATQVLTLQARGAMRPAILAQDQQRVIGAGPKLLATAGK